MICVSLSRGAGGITAVAVRGHAGYAAHGRDIVCSAVSALALTAAIAVERRGGGAETREEPSFVSADAASIAGDEARKEGIAILGAVADGLRAIQEQYPDFVTIEEV